MTDSAQQPEESGGARRHHDDPRLAAYAAVAARRSQYDALMWQVPAFGLAGQALLLGIAVGVGYSALVRTLAAALAVGLSLLSIQLMSKHRAHEMADSRILEAIERDLQMGVWVGAGTPDAGPSAEPRLVYPHSPGWQRIAGTGVPVNWLQRGRSYRWWLGGLALFLAVALALAVLGLVEMLTGVAPLLR